MTRNIFNQWRWLKKTGLSMPKDQGYTLAEILVGTVVFGVLGALSVTSINSIVPQRPLEDSVYKLQGILQQTRTRAIATTSAIRIMPDPDDPERTLKVEVARTRGCDSVTALTADLVEDAADNDLDVEDIVNNDRILPVVSVRGFAVGDTLKVGSDETDNEIIAIDGNLSTIELGQDLGTDQAEDAVVELANNWRSDGSLVKEDLTLSDGIVVTSNIPDDNWTLCFDSRGLARLYDAGGVVDDILTLTVTEEQSNDSQQMTILRGGALEIN
ncbi:MAG: prepilin-type cleavage/methylation domain-containing protein [Cyanobacterium sp. T60_A2020_053]|nr:prepilin-type cleavage/methylation domain-containing protein [Cyanobacterium sp. T60_A2020_053]